jgi:hypothetical protein
MAWFGRSAKKHRYYLLPGMGGSNLRRKERRFFAWSVVAALVVCACLALLLYALGTR